LQKPGAESNPGGTDEWIKDQISRPATPRNRAAMSGALGPSAHDRLQNRQKNLHQFWIARQVFRLYPH
jgi:hypothetical protein